jgi:hypothetical protein
MTRWMIFARKSVSVGAPLHRHGRLANDSKTGVLHASFKVIRSSIALRTTLCVRPPETKRVAGSYLYEQTRRPMIMPMVMEV